ERVWETVVRVAPGLFGLTRCALFLWDPAERTMRPTAAWGLADELRQAFLDLQGPPRGPAVLRALEPREPVLVDAAALPSAIPETVAAAFGIRSMLIVPLFSSGRLMGAMTLDSPGTAHRFSAKQIAVARGLAAHVAVAADHVRLYADTEQRRRE